jgi:hypothetical protein
MRILSDWTIGLENGTLIKISRQKNVLTLFRRVELNFHKCLKKHCTSLHSWAALGY